MSSGASRAKISTASWSARKSDPLTVSNACVSAESAPALPRAALIPPSAAPEWLRVGWSFEMTATFAPWSCASMAARMPAQPAPTTSTSYVGSMTRKLPDAGGERPGQLPQRTGRGDGLAGLGCEPRLEVRGEHRCQLLGLRVVRVAVAPGRARIEQRRLHTRHADGHAEAEDGVGAVFDVVELARKGSVKEAAGGLDRHAVAFAVRSAGPPGVDEPDGRAVPVELLAEQARVHGRRLRQ